MATGFERLFKLTLAAGALAVAWGTLLEPQMLVVRHDEVVLDAWKGAPLRVAMIADLHVGSPWNGVDRVEALAERVSAEHPDVVVLTGDYAINRIFGGHKVAPGDWAPAIGAIDAPLGVYAVLGNHDWWNDEDAYRRAFEAAGVKMMDNRSAALRSGDDRIWLVGLGDSWTDHTDVEAAFAGVPRRASTIAFGHEPDIVDAVGRQADLVLAGHTHGGQVYIPIFSQRLLKLRFRRGRYDVHGVPLYVSSGVGMSVYPVRFGVPPEVVMLTVRGTEAAAGEHPTLTRGAQ